MIAIQDFLAKFQNVKRTGENQWEARCPSHEDNRASLHIAMGDKGIVLDCKAGCRTHDVVWAVDCKMTDLFLDGPKRKGGKGGIEAVYQYHDAEGNDLFQVVRLRDPKRFLQRRDAEQEKWSVKGIDLCLYHLPDVVAAESVVVVEGEKDADNLAKLGFVATCNAGGAAAGKSKWLPAYNDTLAGKHVVIIPDLDKPDKQGERAGTRHALHVAGQLKGKAASIKIVELPIEEKQDVSDWIANGGTAVELRKIIEATPEWGDDSTLSAAFAHGSRRTKEDKRYPVEVIDDEHVTNEAALQGLSLDPTLYCRGGDVVKVIKERVGCDVVPKMIRLGNAVMRDRLSANCYFFQTKIDKEGEEAEKQVRPPQSTVNAIAGRGHFDDVMRPLHGVVTSPFIRPDGCIVSTPGYDEATGFLYCPIGEQPPINDNPTRDEAVEAVDTLLEVVRDFPFDKPEDAAAWVALVLTMVARATFHGPTPMWLIDANTRGAGKGLLADVATMIATGRPVSVTPIPEDDAEMRKRITATAINGDSVVLLDNADCALGSASLDAVLTSTVWKDRILGKSEQIELPINAVWIATGNNLQIKGDLSRRVVQVRLVSDQERPEERADFAHRDLREYVRENRPKLYAAALCVLRAWYVAGRPKHTLKAWGSYEAWSGVIRESMAFVYQHDPILTRDRVMTTSDTETAAIAAVLESWPELSRYMSSDEGAGVSATAKEIIKAIQEQPDRLPLMSAAVENLTGQSGVKLSSRSLGRRFTQYHMRVVGGKRLVGVTAHGGIKTWMVQDAQ